MGVISLCCDFCVCLLVMVCCLRFVWFAACVEVLPSCFSDFVVLAIWFGGTYVEFVLIQLSYVECGLTVVMVILFSLRFQIISCY